MTAVSDGSVAEGYKIEYVNQDDQDLLAGRVSLILTLDWVSGIELG